MKKVVILIFIISPLLGFSCASFKYVTNDQVFAAKNFDWYSGSGYVIKNNRSQSKCTYLNYDGLNTCWTSKYGSITFNQNGKEFPYGGINEQGLVVEMLWLKETIYKEYQEDATKLSELEWIQYQLDNYRSVDEIIANIDKLTVDPITSTLHYFVVDRTGKSAIIEHISGDIVITVSNNQTQSITNTSYVTSNAFYTRSKANLGDYYKPKNTNSQLRYCSIRNNTEKFTDTKEFSVDEAFAMLETISEDRGAYKTYWKIFYDLTNQRVTFKTHDNTNNKSLRLSDLDFDSNTATYYDLSSMSQETDITSHMRDYSPTINYTLVEECIKPKLSFDYDQLNNHQMTPYQSNQDETFADNHQDVTVLILTNKHTGAVRYFLADSEENYRRQGPYGGFVEISKDTTFHKLYSLPTSKDYAFGAMHDVNGNGRLDRNFLKMPKEPFVFSGRKRFFFLPPKYKKAVIEFSDEIIIDFR